LVKNIINDTENDKLIEISKEFDYSHEKKKYLSNIINNIKNDKFIEIDKEFDYSQLKKN